jgi:hypothetical protein
MISRLTASATLFAICATVSLAWATATPQRIEVRMLADAGGPLPQATATLPRVEVNGRRADAIR